MNKHEMLEILAQIFEREHREAKLLEELKKLAAERAGFITKLTVALDIKKE
jgi:hypothetical protein